MASAYLWIFVAALFFSSQFVFSKLFQQRSDGSMQANLWMVLLHSVWVLALFGLGGFSSAPSWQAILFALCFGISDVACTVASVAAYSRGKLVTVTLYCMIGGQAVPFIYGLLFTGARPTWLACLGFALTVLSCLPNVLDGLMTPEKDVPAQSKSRREHIVFLLLCLVVFLGNGFVSVFSDANAKSPAGAPSTDFLVLCSLWMLLFGAALLLWQMRLHRGEKKSAFDTVFAGLKCPKGWRSLLVVAAIVGIHTVLNSMGNIFSLRAAAVPGMQSSVQFPVLNALIMVLTMLIGRVIFKEKITRRDVLSLVLLVAGILLFMISFLVYGK